MQRQTTSCTEIACSMAEGGEEIDLVAALLSRPFSSRTFQEKLDNVEKGQTTPKPDNELKPMPEIHQGRLDCLAIASMAIEKYFMVEMKCIDNLSCSIIELFLSKEGRMDVVDK